MNQTATAEARDVHALAELVASLARRDGWSREEVERHQRKRLGELIEFAVGSSPFYRESLGPDAARRPLSELPVLTKTTVMEQFDRLVTDPRLRREAVEDHLAGPDPAAEFAGEYALVTTSGTTGARGVFAYSREEMMISLAATLRTVARLGGRPGMRLIGIGAPSPLFMSRRVFAGLQAGTGSRAPDLSVLSPLEEAVAGLNAFQPEGLLGYPSVIAMLAEEQLEGRLRIAPRVVGTGSEVLTADHAARIESAWGIRPGNAYVATEVCPIASSCPREVGLHVCDDLVVLEVVDADYRPVPPGVPGERVLVTNLVNRAQPLIRYEITDSVILAEGPNPTGMPWRRIESVSGRTAEILRLSDGRGGEVDVHPHHLRAPFASMPDVLGYQFELDESRITVDLALRERAPDPSGEVAEKLRRILDDQGARGVTVTARVVSHIQREQGAAAKLKQVRMASG